MDGQYLDKMNEPTQTNLDEIYLDEIKTNTMKSELKKQNNRVIHFHDGDSIEVDENENCIIVNEDKKVGLRPKRLKLFQLISSPIDQFLSIGNIGKKTANISSSVGKKTLKKVDSLGETIAHAIGITDSKFSNEINSRR